MRGTTYIALLRGINVGGHNRIPMAELRAACSDLGWADVQTYIQSGNILVRTDATALGVEKKVERLIERHFGLEIPVIARAARDWSAYTQGNPLADESAAEPNAVMLALSKTRPQANAADALQERANNGERIIRVGDALWIHFARGFAKSKLSTVLLDKLVGSPVTMRNWRTVLKLKELAEGEP